LQNLFEKKIKKIKISETENGARDDGEVNDGKDGWTEGLTDGRTDRQKLRNKERKTDGRMNVRRALSSHCPGRNLRMFMTNR
jgi:hypothetical protein